MNRLNLEEVKDYVEKNIGSFHAKRIARLAKLKLAAVLKSKNPYLFRAKNVLKASELIDGFSSAYISSSEEGIFGEFLEGLAIFVCSKVYNGWKSGIPGIDLEFDKEGIRYIVSLKSGPNWGNSRQQKAMIDNFKIAAKTIRTNDSKIRVIAVNGCCYGKDNRPDKGDFYKYCGQSFWEFISGNNNLYTEIIEPLGYKAKEKNDEYILSYAQMVNKFTLEFTQNFCIDGRIEWERLVKFNSSAD